ncbi:MAG TPA: hypothetical protein VM266_10485 [Solirubrobacteraceae bacterium]|nr:hypothetical protein [Solirubrobacteraceae bacterium]
MASLAELECGDDPARWADLGFAVTDGELVRLGPVAVRCTGGGGGLRGWTLRGDGGPESIDGIPTRWTGSGDGEPGPAHPNGAAGLDHVVVFTDHRDRTAAALVAAGGDERRRAGPPSVPVAMSFVRLGPAIVEVAEAGREVRLWGLVAVVEDLDATAAGLGDRLGAIKDAVQPGRRIATVRPEAGLDTALAFMSPRQR